MCLNKHNLLLLEAAAWALGALRLVVLVCRLLQALLVLPVQVPLTRLVLAVPLPAGCLALVLQQLHLSSLAQACLPLLHLVAPTFAPLQVG